MLKIRYDFNLKKLEDYKFKKRERWYECYDELVTVEVEINTREVYLYSTGAEEVQTMDIPDVIFDLIKENIIIKD